MLNFRDEVQGEFICETSSQDGAARKEQASERPIVRLNFGIENCELEAKKYLANKQRYYQLNKGFSAWRSLPN